MAFDHERHMLDPMTGYQVDKETGEIAGLFPAQTHSVPMEYPKWVEVHPSFIVVKGEGVEKHVSTPLFEYFHVNRANGMVTVMVADAEEEKRAVAPKEA